MVNTGVPSLRLSAGAMANERPKPRANTSMSCGINTDDAVSCGTNDAVSPGVVVARPREPFACGAISDTAPTYAAATVGSHRPR